MEEILKQIVEKISSYNIFNNLYPGVLFIYLSKFIFEIKILSDNWFENLIVFYFAGMVLSRIGSIIIEAIMKKINEICLKNKITFLQENKDWIFLILLILLFAFSYVKQTDYVRKRVEFVLRKEKKKETR